MRKEKNYIQDIAEIRSMMERSSKFLSLSGWAGAMAGIYALTGFYIVNSLLDFSPNKILYDSLEELPNFNYVFITAILVVILAVATAVFLSYKRGIKIGESIWNSTSKRLLTDMGIPLAVGGILILIFISKNLIGLIIPFTLLFYGLALYNTSKFTYNEVKYLGIIQMMLGIIALNFIEYSIYLWAFGFGIVHIIYGIYLHFRYER
ncbi:MAG: hypothetical protein K8F60_07080 [Melioribacteraceae bacterium]|jgi:hypothetical protein|nr:hypothetical protein [Melioribacteraceae bacterium]